MWSLATLPAFVVSGLTALATLGWLWSSTSSGATWVVAALFTVGLTLVSFYGMRLIMVREFAPLTRLADHMRAAAVRSRDHISFLRNALSDQKPRTAVEIADVEHALEQFTTRVEQRHARQMAWIVAVVHDVKTPIAGAANTLDALSRVPRLRDTSESELVARVADELRSLVVDVQRVVDVVRFERDDVEIEPQTIDVAEVAGSIASRIAADRRDVAVTVRGRGTCIGDVTLLTRALENLMSNAVRHARRTVTVEVNPGLVRIADDGPGLPAPLEVLAQPFRSEAIEVGGVVTSGGAGGIGLFLAKRALEAHGGRLILESTGARGTGTVLLAYLGSVRHG